MISNVGRAVLLMLYWDGLGAMTRLDRHAQLTTEASDGSSERIQASYIELVW